MRVSVIIPTYNRAALLERCLQSLTRSGLPKLEVIVVDDGGTDDSERICEQFDCVRYVRQDNAGVSAARNRGLAVSTGGFVAFIDSDDEWIHGGGSRLATQLDQNPDVGVVFADCSMGSDSSGFVSFIETYGGDAFRRLEHEPRSGGLRVLERRSFLPLLSTRNVMFLGSMMFRREAIEQLGGFDTSLSGAADWDVFMRAAVDTVVAFSEGPPVARYYKHDQGMSTDNDHMAEDFIKALDSVRSRCELGDAERRHIDSRIRQHSFGWAYQAYDRGDLLTARTRLRFVQSLGVAGARELVFLGATYLPVGVVASLRRARHALGI